MRTNFLADSGSAVTLLEPSHLMSWPMAFRRQLPAYSPISLKALSRSFSSATTDPAAVLSGLRTYLADRFVADQVILTGSGTQALQLALSWAGASGRVSEERGPVALPAYSCFDVVSAAAGAGSRVLFYDVVPETLVPDLDSLRSALRAGARTVVAANLYGFPLDWDVLRKACSDGGAVLVEDAAQGIGSSWGPKEGGSFGDLTCLSFGRGKGWTGGSGGALLIRNRVDEVVSDQEGLDSPGALKGVTSLLACGAQWALGRPALYWLPASLPGLTLGETLYKVPSDPVAMSPHAAAAVRAHAELALEAVSVRRGAARRWRESLEGAVGIRCCEPIDESACGYLRFPCVAASAAEAERLARSGRYYGVARGYPIALSDLPQARELLVGRSTATPGARRLASSLVTLPTHTRVSTLDVLGVSRAVASEPFLPFRTESP